MQTDTIGDFLTQIRNANVAGRLDLETYYSRMKADIAAVLEKEGYVQSFSLEKREGKQKLLVKLKNQGKRKTIRGIQRISKPGLRRYVSSQEVPRVLGGLGIAILSTSRGVMSGHEAKKQNVGGEVLAYVW